MILFCSIILTSEFITDAVRSGPPSRRSSTDTSADASISPKAIWNALRNRLQIGRHRRLSAWESVQRDCSDYFITTVYDREREQQLGQKEKKELNEAKYRERARSRSGQLAPTVASFTSSSAHGAPAARKRFSCDWGVGFGGVLENVDESPSLRSVRPLALGSVAEFERGAMSWSNSPHGKQVNSTSATRPVGGQRLRNLLREQLDGSAVTNTPTWLSNIDCEIACEEASAEQHFVIDSCMTSTTSLGTVAQMPQGLFEGPMGNMLEERAEAKSSGPDVQHPLKVSSQVKLSLKER